MALKQKQHGVIKELRDKSSGTASKLTQFEQELQDKIEAALAEKQTFVKTEERGVVDMRRNLRELEQRIASENSKLQALQVFQVVGQQENMKTIEDLENTIQDMKDGHEQVCTAARARVLPLGEGRRAEAKAESVSYSAQTQPSPHATQ